MAMPLKKHLLEPKMTVLLKELLLEPGMAILPQPPPVVEAKMKMREPLVNKVKTKITPPWAEMAVPLKIPQLERWMAVSLKELLLESLVVMSLKKPQLEPRMAVLLREPLLELLMVASLKEPQLQAWMVASLKEPRLEPWMVTSLKELQLQARMVVPLKQPLEETPAKTPTNPPRAPTTARPPNRRPLEVMATRESRETPMTVKSVARLALLTAFASTRNALLPETRLLVVLLTAVLSGFFDVSRAVSVAPARFASTDSAHPSLKLPPVWPSECPAQQPISASSEFVSLEAMLATAEV